MKMNNSNYGTLNQNKQGKRDQYKGKESEDIQDRSLFTYIRVGKRRRGWEKNEEGEKKRKREGKNKERSEKVE